MQHVKTTDRNGVAATYTLEPAPDGVVLVFRKHRGRELEAVGDICNGVAAGFGNAERCTDIARVAALAGIRAVPARILFEHGDVRYRACRGGDAFAIWQVEPQRRVVALIEDSGAVRGFHIGDLEAIALATAAGLPWGGGEKMWPASSLERPHGNA